MTYLGGLLHPLLGPQAWEQSPHHGEEHPVPVGETDDGGAPTRPGLTTEHPLSLRLKSGCSVWGPCISSACTPVLEGQALCLDIKPGACSGDIRAS